jgi:hypothetical protein
MQPAQLAFAQLEFSAFVAVEEPGEETPWPPIPNSEEQRRATESSPQRQGRRTHRLMQ